MTLLHHRVCKFRKCFTISFYLSHLPKQKPKNGTNQISIAAYKHADGKKIDGKRVLVDVERARTVKGWLPRRLGGGLGGTRRGGVEVNIKHSGREDNVREKERYRLEREKEDRRVDDRRGDSKFWRDFKYEKLFNSRIFRIRRQKTVKIEGKKSAASITLQRAAKKT